jgi:hypothetical protein
MKAPFKGFNDRDNFENQQEFKRQSSHGHFNYYLSKEDQLNRYQKIKIKLIEDLENEKKEKEREE